MIETERFKLIPAVYLILRDQDNVLLLKRQNTGWEDGKFSLIAGHLDGSEPATAAMAREAYEEAGISVDPKGLKLTHVMHKNLGEERIDLYFTANRWDGTIKNMEPHKCSELVWHSIKSLPENMIPQVRQALELSEAGISYSEAGWI